MSYDLKIPVFQTQPCKNRDRSMQYSPLCCRDFFISCIPSAVDISHNLYGHPQFTLMQSVGVNEIIRMLKEKYL